MGGETQCVEVSAKQRLNLDKLVESILLQAEVLDLKANPNRPAEGVVVETKIERGRGSVATVLVQRGTLRLGDNFVAGSEWGRIRGLTDANGTAVESAEPGMPVEVLGLNGTPRAGDDLIVVDSESRARDVAEFRQRRLRDARVKELKARCAPLAASLGRQRGGGAQVTLNERGKTRTVYVPKDLTEEVAQSIQEYRRLKTLLREITQLQLALIRLHKTAQARRAGRP
jgi:translation initiation factor IF-2